MPYTVYEFYSKDEVERDWLISILGDHHFEGFEETNDSLKAYAPADKVTEIMVRELLYDNEMQKVEFTHQPLEDKNWNEEWEKNFEPVVIADRVAIRAPFHPPIKADYEIIIEPKMSFGTGHHATTASMVQGMLKEEIKGKTVLDFGSGTGVLAILAEKLGSTHIVAIDNEEWAYNNCLENVERNNCVCIKTIKGDDTFVFSEKFEVILANINRNVILKNIAYWTTLLQPHAILMVSGILQADEKDILAEAKKNGLQLKDTIESNGWMAITFTN
ncbi:MAG TPA: 50S ribosomal protein L11 methyltransferase [Chitinophagales bacterium]|nr:50S ribosomal protein L11 methyltransferase [Chitinophagales bacterium]